MVEGVRTDATAQGNQFPELFRREGDRRRVLAVIGMPILDLEGGPPLPVRQRLKPSHLGSPVRQPIEPETMFCVDDSGHRVDHRRDIVLAKRIEEPGIAEVSVVERDQQRFGRSSEKFARFERLANWSR